MEEEKNNQGTGMGVGALVTGIIAFLIAVVPCVGIVAVVPAAIAIILAIIGLSRPNNNQGVLIGGLVVAIVALMISISQSFIIGKIGEKSDHWATNIEKAVKDIGNDLESEFNDNDVTIRIKHDNDSISIKASTRRGDLENKLDELESDSDTVVKVTVEKGKN